MTWVPPDRTWQELAEFVVGTLKQLGVNIPPASRLGRMHRIYVKNEQIDSGDGHQIDVVLEAFRDFSQLEAILEQRDYITPSDRLLELLDRVVSDTDLPQDSSDQTPGRNHQFELYVAARCVCAGFDRVTLEEPDLSFFYEGKKTFVAAKRVKGNKAKTRVKQAAEQIYDALTSYRRDASGIITLDLSRAMNPENKRYVSSRSHDACEAAYVDALEAIWMAKYSRDVQDVLKRPQSANVLGLIVHDSHVVKLRQGKWFPWQMAVGVPSESLSRDSVNQFRRLVKSYDQGITNR